VVIITSHDQLMSLEDKIHVVFCTLPSQWFLVPAGLILRVSTTAIDSVNSGISSKEGAVISAVLGTRKFVFQVVMKANDLGVRVSY
jgi:hypothetical protein